VLDPVAGKDPSFSAIHPDREVDDELPLARPEELAQAVIQAKLISYCVELGQGGLIRRGLLSGSGGLCHTGPSCTALAEALLNPVYPR
jgi:hypothetical protein